VVRKILSSTGSVGVEIYKHAAENFENHENRNCDENSGADFWEIQPPHMGIL
jgi:hypothetical protein